MLLLSKAVIVPVASEVSKLILWRVSEGLDADALTLPLPDCVMVIVFMLEIVLISVTVLAESCARTTVASAKLRRDEARIFAGVVVIWTVSRVAKLSIDIPKLLGGAVGRSVEVACNCVKLCAASYVPRLLVVIVSAK